MLQKCYQSLYSGLGLSRTTAIFLFFFKKKGQRGRSFLEIIIETTESIELYPIQNASRPIGLRYIPNLQEQQHQ